MSKKNIFTVESTNIAKGIAIFLLLFHHLGIEPDLNLFSKTSFLLMTAKQFRVCVCIFVILSGFGLNESFNKKYKYKILDFLKFVFKHLLKLMTNYWIIFILFVTLGCLMNFRTLDVYGDNVFKNLVIDFFGLAKLFKTPTFNATWWFMSLIILLYLIFPILKFLLKKWPLLLILIVIYLFKFKPLTFYNGLNRYTFSFALGMLISEFGLFEKLKKLNKNYIECIIVSLLYMILGFYGRRYFSGVYEIIFAIAIICFSVLIISKTKILKKFIVLIGKNSSNIFMLHTFIYKYFFLDFFLKLKYCPIMFIVLLIISLGISMLIEKIKDLFQNMLKNKKLNKEAVV